MRDAGRSVCFHLQLSKFSSWLPQRPQSTWRTRLRLHGKEKRVLVFNPFTLIKDCLEEIREEESELILIRTFSPYVLNYGSR